MTSSRTLKKFRRVAVFAIAFVSGLWICDRWMTARSIADDTMPATAPATAPATRPAFSADVQAVVDRIVAAYAKTPLRLEGEIVSDFDVAGVAKQQTIPLAAAHGVGESFRHEAKGQMLLVADGTTLHLYDPANNTYGEWKLAEATPATWQGMLASVNPALLIAVTGEAADAIAFDGSPVEKLAAVTENGRPLDRLESTHEGATRRTFVDAKSGTIDRIEFDFVKLLEAQGAAAVKKANVTIRYGKTDVGGEPIDAAQFAFAPPADATPLGQAGGAAQANGGADASTLEGKDAPALELKDLDDKTVKLSDAKGSVVVLDFWATWCPPCRKGLPHLAEAAKKYADKGVKVFAVNQEEDAATVKKFLADQKLELHALLDTDGAAGKSYLVTGIPQTVVIGGDGKVKKVIVGFDESIAGELGNAIDAALKR